jgi:hypothetical protein
LSSIETIEKHENIRFKQVSREYEAGSEVENEGTDWGDGADYYEDGVKSI